MFKEFHYQVRGRGHLREGTPVQDRTMYLSRGGVQVLCLADGAGSAPHSDFGAQAVVDEGCRVLTEQFAEFVASSDGARVKQDILLRLQQRLRDVAQRHGFELSELASTFLCIAVAGDSFICVHIGDGVIGYLKNGELKVISAPRDQEFVNQTTFVTSEAAANAMSLLRGSLQGVEGFVLMSDGTAESLFNPRNGELATACFKLITAVGSAPAQQGKNSAYKKQLRRLFDTRIRNATKDDCSIGVLGRPLAS